MSDNTNNGFPVPEEPLTREEEYLSAIAGVTASTEIPEKPLTRVEAYLDKIVENGGGGGGGGTVNNAKITIQKNGTDVESFTLNQSTDETINISGIAEADSNGQIEAATVKAGALEDGMTATTQATSDDSTKLATTAYVHDVVDALPEPMIFTGSITLTADSTDTSTAAITVSAPASAADIVKGYTYKVTSIASSPVYTGSIKVGDTLIAAKNAPTVSASWVADTDWTIVPSGDETGYVVGLPSGTSSGQLMAFGADGYSAANSGVSVANNTTGISDVDTAVPTSKAVIHKTAHAATLDDYTPETGTYTDKITTTDTIDTAIKKLDTRSRANENNISKNVAELVELVDNGAKSLVDFPSINPIAVRSSYTTITDGYTITGNAGAAYPYIALPFTNFKAGDYVLKITVSAFTSADAAIFVKKGNYSTGTTIASQMVTRTGDISIPFTLDTDSAEMGITIYPNQAATEAQQSISVSKLMICTQAAWDVSQKFVSYRPTYEETVEQVAENEDNISKITPTTTYKTNHAFQSANYELINDIYIDVPDGKRIFLVVGAKQANVTGVAVCFNTQTYDAAKIVISQEVSTAQQMISCAGCYDNGNGGQSYRLSVFAKGVAGSQLNCRVTLSWWYL